MKFLRHWAGAKSLVTASHFFWSAGTLQKSQQGLLQTLLYWVLRECPNLAKSICPGRLADLCSHKGSSRTSPPWTRDGLFEVLSRLVKQDTSSVKFCFSVDGLDEYEGDHSEIVNILAQFSKSKSLKICVSTRPWNIFELAYGQEMPRFLRLQGLTRGGIGRFVRDNLVENNQFKVLQNIDTRYNSLVKEIVNKAEGVFLWVFLVVRSLKERITNADSIAILTKRLHELPSDLESFFKHTLGQVERVYREGTTRMFQLAITAVEPLPLMKYSIVDEEPDFALKLTPRHLSDEEIDKHCEILEKRLNARCKGLLEVTMQNKSSNQFTKRRVDFLHRTVRDFLRLGEVQETLAAQLSQPLDIYLALCKGLLIRAKRLPFFDQKTLQSIMDDLTHYANLIERLFQHPPTEIIDEMTRLTVKNSRVVRPFMGSSLNEPNWGRKISDSEQLHPFVFQKGLQHYIEGKLPQIPVVYNYIVDRFSLLNAALLLPAIPSKYDSLPHPSLVRLFLDNGENPNTITHNAETTWTYFLKIIFESGSLPSKPLNIWFATVEILLQGGADCNTQVNAFGRKLSPMQIFDTIFTKEEAKALKELYVRRGGRLKGLDDARTENDATIENDAAIENDSAPENNTMIKDPLSATRNHKRTASKWRISFSKVLLKRKENVMAS